MKRWTLSIPQPCSEQWENFTATEQGGFCANCQKEVIDFTTWDEERIKAYFKDVSHKVCGKFYVQQLKTYTFHENSAKRQNAWLPLSLLGCTMLFARTSEAQTTHKPLIETTQTEGRMSNEDSPQANSVKIQGVVLDAAAKTPLPGALIKVKGTNHQTYTDAEGKFTLNIPPVTAAGTLMISFTGYKFLFFSLEKAGKEKMTILLEENSKSITKGKIILGLGTAPKRKAFWSPITGWFK